jgi:thiamine pyrophosphate-dependent acetolactate synthase large subunit-like protein
MSRIALGKEVITSFFERNGVTHIFHLPGIHTLPINETLRKSNLCVLIGRHESNVGFMADGYARATGRPGTLLLTPGPGLANVASPCMEAYGDDVPLVIINVDVNRKDMDKGILHGVVKPEAIMDAVTKDALVAGEGMQLADMLAKAYRVAQTERTGPVLLSIPYKLLDKKVLLGTEEETTANDKDGETASLEEALERKRKPVIIAGKAAMNEEIGMLLEEICHQSSIPLLTTTSGKGVLREDDELCFGNVIAKGTARDILKEADTVIAVGTRLRDVDTKRRGVKLSNLIHSDVDDRWFRKNYRTEHTVAGPIKRTVETLRLIMKGRESAWNIEGLKRNRQRELADLQKNEIGFRIISLLRQVIPAETVTVWDLSLISYWAEYYFPAFCQRSFLTPRGCSPIFYALPASIGAKLGRPDRPCLCVVGDGSFVAIAGELATVKKYGVPVVILVYNNSSFGVLEDYMRKRYAVEGEMNLFTPDLLTLAGAFEIPAKRVDTLEHLAKLFKKEIQWDRPYIIDFRYPLFSPPWH